MIPWCHSVTVPIKCGWKRQFCPSDPRQAPVSSLFLSRVLSPAGGCGARPGELPATAGARAWGAPPPAAAARGPGELPGGGGMRPGKLPTGGCSARAWRAPRLRRASVVSSPAGGGMGSGELHARGGGGQAGASRCSGARAGEQAVQSTAGGR